MLLRRRGGQHACLVADALGMTRVFIHPLAGVLSAYGMGLADVTAMREQAVEARLDEANERLLGDMLEALARAARRAAAPGRWRPIASAWCSGCTCATTAPIPR